MVEVYRAYLSVTTVNKHKRLKNRTASAVLANRHNAGNRQMVKAFFKQLCISEREWQLHTNIDIVYPLIVKGFLPVGYVVEDKDCITYLDEINSERENYNEFILVTIEFTSLMKPKIAYYANTSSSPPVSLSPGIYAFGNSVEREKPWPKESKLKDMFTEVVKKYPSVSTKQTLVDELLKLLQNGTRYTVDDNMKRQGKSKSSTFLEKLSAIFVNIPESNYGSRCHTIVLIDGSGNVDYTECTRSENLQQEDHNEWHKNHHIFKLDD
ncbi:transport and Golgi organization 2 [Caerostris extrusa]|uniref:Transport and Golgi organization 2 n=1 Tax=Caerostris extrusa TaxID=172846 RepID=A0AAV4SC46_CAEEX|nr:transport and Golgi organization 2 [Caerostris extrusa]